MKNASRQGKGRGSAQGTSAGQDTAFEGAFSEDRRLVLEQAAAMLGSRFLEERLKGRSILLGLVLNGGSGGAKELLNRDCRKAMASETMEERRHARSVLGQLVAKKDCPESRRVLEENCKQAIDDFDLDALVFLGMNARGTVGSEVDAALERNFERIVKGLGLDTLAYIAAMSNCSLTIRRRAAAISADCEQRKGNLAFIHDATEDGEIKNMMEQALRRRER